MFDDDALLSPAQRAQLRAVIAAVELGVDDVHQTVNRTFTPPLTREEVALILGILNSDAVRYQRGEPVEQVVGRVLDVIEDIAEGRGAAPPTAYGDDRY